MNPLAVRALNYRTFETLDLDLPAGCCAIVGENGSGKSSIVNVADLALFGPVSRTLADQLTIDGDGTELMLELTFEQGGEIYRARRGYSARGAGKSTLDLEQLGPGWHAEPDEHGDPVQVQSPAEWEPLTRENVKATQAALEQLLGLSRRTFRASAFLAQGDGAAFTEAEPGKRKEILADIIALSRWDDYAELAKADRKAAESELATLRVKTDEARELVETKPDVALALGAATGAADEAQAALAAGEQALEQATIRFQEAKTLTDAVATADAELRAAHAKLAGLQQTVDRAAEARDQTAPLHDEIAGLAPQAELVVDLEKQRDELARRREQRAARAREREQLLGQVNQRELAINRGLAEAGGWAAKSEALQVDAQMLADAAADSEHTCDRCGQTLGHEARERAIGSYREEADELARKALDATEWAQGEQAEVAELRARADEIVLDEESTDEFVESEKKLADARAAQMQLAALSERKSQLEQTIKAAEDRDFLMDISAARAAAGAAAKQHEDTRAAAPTADAIEEIKQAGLRARGQVNEQRQRLTDAQAEKVRLEERLARLLETEEKIKQAAVRDQELATDVEVAAQLERAYGRDGIPALIVENTAIPQIEAEANRVLAELPTGDGTVFRVELHTQRALKSGDGLRDVLDIVVYTPAGERAYETFSEGEKTRLNLALRIALASLLASRRGADSRCLIVDEPENLDESGTAALAAILRALVERGTFDKVYLVSHVPSLRDAFDQTIQVVKESGRSRVAGALDREAVTV